MSTNTYPVDLRLVATVYDSETNEPVLTIEVDNTKAAPIQEINVQLDAAGYSPMFYDGHFGTYRTTRRGTRRV